AQTVERLVGKVEDLRAQCEEHAAPQKAVDYRSRPPVLRGRTVQANVGCGPLYITLNEDTDGRPFEVFFKLGKSGSCQQSYLEALGVAMSVGLRYGADPQKFVEKFEGMRCPNPKLRDAHGPTTLSCADGISQGLAKALTLALPIADIEPRPEADVIAVAEPRFPLAAEEDAENRANARSLDLVEHAAITAGVNGGSVHPKRAQELPEPNLRKAMMTGVGMCPKCGGNLISQGGCIRCIAECGYVGKCS
ncbi:MAG: hypothetical protein ACREEA_11385, partial [Stellaceae bacterium]